VVARTIRHLNLNSPLLAAGIGSLAFRQLSGIAAFHKIVTRFYLMVGIMFKILLIISVVVAIFCMGVVITCILAAARENGLPDIDDVDLVELFSSKIQP
jgi:hypothetical protein